MRKIYLFIQVFLLFLSACTPVEMSSYDLETQGKRLIEEAHSIGTATADAYHVQMAYINATQIASDVIATQTSQSVRLTSDATTTALYVAQLQSEATQTEESIMLNRIATKSALTLAVTQQVLEYKKHQSDIDRNIVMNWLWNIALIIFSLVFVALVSWSFYIAILTWRRQKSHFFGGHHIVDTSSGNQIMIIPERQHNPVSVISSTGNVSSPNFTPVDVQTKITTQAQAVEMISSLPIINSDQRKAVIENAISQIQFNTQSTYPRIELANHSSMPELLDEVREKIEIMDE